MNFFKLFTSKNWKLFWLFIDLIFIVSTVEHRKVYVVAERKSKSRRFALQLFQRSDYIVERFGTGTENFVHETSCNLSLENSTNPLLHLFLLYNCQVNTSQSGTKLLLVNYSSILLRLSIQKIDANLWFALIDWHLINFTVHISQDCAPCKQVTTYQK